MASDLLIPFGISADTGQIIEPEEAESGRSCNCLCPGCRMPLLSRHPKSSDKRIHFAHDTRSTLATKEAIEQCPFNSALAIKLMARHICEQLPGKQLLIPGYNYPLKNQYGLVMRQVTVSHKRQVEIKRVRTEQVLNGDQYDLAIDCADGSSIFVWFAYRGNPAPTTRSERAGDEYILSLDLNSFDTALFKHSKKSFSEMVEEFVLCEGFRCLVSHPGTEKAIKDDEERNSFHYISPPKPKRRPLASRYGQLKSTGSRQPPPSPTPQRYECLNCNAKWLHDKYGTPDCPSGCGHLFSRKLTEA